MDPYCPVRVEELWVHEVWWTSLKDLCNVTDVTVIARILMALVIYAIPYLVVLIPELFNSLGSEDKSSHFANIAFQNHYYSIPT